MASTTTESEVKTFSQQKRFIVSTHFSFMFNFTKIHFMYNFPLLFPQKNFEIIFIFLHIKHAYMSSHVITVWNPLESTFSLSIEVTKDLYQSMRSDPQILRARDGRASGAVFGPLLDREDYSMVGCQFGTLGNTVWLDSEVVAAIGLPAVIAAKMAIEEKYEFEYTSTGYKCESREKAPYILWESVWVDGWSQDGAAPDPRHNVHRTVDGTVDSLVIDIGMWASSTPVVGEKRHHLMR